MPPKPKVKKSALKPTARTAGQKRNRSRVIDDEAGCSDDSPDEAEESDSEGSLADFIANDSDPEVASTAGKADDLLDTDDEDEVLLQKVNTPPKKRGRPPKSATSSSAAVTMKPPGHPAYPTNDFSLTITKSKADVHTTAIDEVAKFMETHCIKGGVATEVGMRAFQYHLQCVMRMHWPTSKEYVTYLSKEIRKLMPQKGLGYKVTLKPCRQGQEFSAMLGYITKDQGKCALFYFPTHAYSRRVLTGIYYC